MRNAIIKQDIRNQMNTTTNCSFLLLPEPQYLLPGPSDSNSQLVRGGRSKVESALTFLPQKAI